jgi:hypothetical protein
MKKSLPVAYLWRLYYKRETHPDYPQPFWNCGTEISREEIRQALDTKDFNRIESCGRSRQGDRAWHVRQIAGIVHLLREGKEFGPIWLNANDTIADGCHRLYAHWFLNRESIDITYDQPK